MKTNYLLNLLIESSNLLKVITFNANYRFYNLSIKNIIY